MLLGSCFKASKLLAENRTCGVTGCRKGPCSGPGALHNNSSSSSRATVRGAAVNVLAARICSCPLKQYSTMQHRVIVTGLAMRFLPRFSSTCPLLLLLQTPVPGQLHHQPLDTPQLTRHYCQQNSTSTTNHIPAYLGTDYQRLYPRRFAPKSEEQQGQEEFRDAMQTPYYRLMR
jgi:hypothetical protein